MGILNRIAGSGERRSASYHPGDPALAELFGAASTTASGVTVTPENARACPEVDACVGLIEDTVATVPLDLFERTGDGTRERRDDHPLHALLHDQPNDRQTSAEFRQMLEGWRSTHGNAYAEIVSGRTGPRSLEPLHPLEVRPFKVRAGGIAYRHTPPDGPSRILMQSEILHLRDKPFKRDLICGQSRVERHREAIGRAMATGEYLSRFFSNYAVPKAFLEAPAGQTLDKAQIELLRDQFDARHAGLHNAHRIGVLQGGLSLKTLGVTNDEAKVIEAYALSVAQIARVWGIPLHLIGEMSKSTSWGTGIEQQSIGFIVYYMRPKFVLWEQALNAALMSSDMRRRFYFEFNVDGLLRGDFKARMEGYALMVQWGLATPNEIRRQMNLPPLPGGDERLHPLNMAPASKIMDVLLRKQGGNTDVNADQATRALAMLVAMAQGRSIEGHLNEH